MPSSCMTMPRPTSEFTAGGAPDASQRPSSISISEARRVERVCEGAGEGARACEAAAAAAAAAVAVLVGMGSMGLLVFAASLKGVLLLAGIHGVDGGVLLLGSAATFSFVRLVLALVALVLRLARARRIAASARSSRRSRASARLSSAVRRVFVWKSQKLWFSPRP